MGWTTEYEGSDILEDGRKFTVRYSTWETHDTRSEPGDYEEFDESYEIDGVACEFEDLPDEVTTTLIDHVKGLAKERDSYSGRKSVC